MSHLDLMRRKSTGHALVLAAQAAKAAEAEEAEEAREVYQNNMADLIWLELQVFCANMSPNHSLQKVNLQAWFAGQNMVDHDKYITNIRETDIKDTIDEILDYEYRTREEVEKVLNIIRCFTLLASWHDLFLSACDADLWLTKREDGCGAVNATVPKFCKI